LSSLTRLPALLLRRPRSTLFPYTTLFRSLGAATAARRRAPDPHYSGRADGSTAVACGSPVAGADTARPFERRQPGAGDLGAARRSEEHTSELQSRFDLVCRLLLEQKNAWI